MQSFIRPFSASHRSNVLGLSSIKSHQKFQLNTRLRLYHDDGRQRLSAFWIPTGGIAHDAGMQGDSHSMLIRGGFLRQAHSGLFQFLPLGLRVQEKIERLIDKHMSKIGASKLSLSTFSSEELWKKSGRLDSSSSELFRLKDRKDIKYLLSPTHEEEITTLISNTVKSYKELPLRIYQITRKYRDEPRPRQGLLRTREFLMKDLYTFDKSTSTALQTYETVRNAYSAFFDEFKIPYLTAEAASGDMGGELSHEYHFPSTKGEDHLIQCTSCSYIRNEELAGTERKFMPRNKAFQRSSIEGSVIQEDTDVSKYSNLAPTFDFWFGISKDRHKAVAAVFPKRVEITSMDQKKFRDARINPHMLKEIVPEIDFSVKDPVKAFQKYVEQNRLEIVQSSKKSLKKFLLVSLFDYRIPESDVINYMEDMKLKKDMESGSAVPFQINGVNEDEKHAPDLVRIDAGDPCPRCKNGTLKVQTAVELGHTFHLGTRYSKPLKATIATDPSQELDLGDLAAVEEPTGNSSKQIQQKHAYLQMGCHGIGVSRLIAAIADSLADSKGLNWPRVIAPFEAIIIATKGLESAATEIYDLINNRPLSGAHNATIDAILDDREKDFGWKLKDADLIGYPIIVVVGRAWQQQRKCEVQCRRLGGLRVEIDAAEVRGKILELLDRL